jgi:hypothetical protein
MALLLPSTQDIDATVVAELALFGGTISDRFDDGERLFLRALLPRSDEVLPQDVVKGGIAVRTIGREIEVCPYLFRQVCRNGAIMPQVFESQRIERADVDAPSEAIEAVDDQLRAAVRACSAAEAFAHATRQVRLAATREVPRGIFHLLLFSSFRRAIPANLQEEIMRSFLESEDHSAFDLMNAVTAVARDQRDPEVRWRLEELGGGVPALKFPEIRPGDSEAELEVFEVRERLVLAAGR